MTTETRPLPINPSVNPIVRSQPRRSLGYRLLPYLLIAPPVILVFVMIFFPAIQSFIRTLTPDDTSASTALSFSRYVTFFNDSISVSNLIFTLEITIISTVLLALIGLGLALYLRFRKNRISNLVQGLAIFPLFVPGIILAYAMIQFLGPRGTVDNLIHATGTKFIFDAVYRLFGLAGYRTAYLRPEGIVISVVWESIPFTVLILSAALGQIDDAVIESARDVGASIWQVFLRIILPLIQRGLVIVLCLNFIGILGSYTLPYLLGPAAPQMMGVFMNNTYGEFQAPREAETQAIITFLASALVGMLYIRTIIRQQAGRDQVR